MRVTNGITKIKTASMKNKFFNWIGTILLLVGFITFILIIVRDDDVLLQNVRKSYAKKFNCIISSVSTHNGIIEVDCKNATLFTDTGTSIESEQFLDIADRGDSISKDAMSRIVNVFKLDVDGKFTDCIELVVYGNYHEL